MPTVICYFFFTFSFLHYLLGTSGQNVTLAELEGLQPHCPFEYVNYVYEKKDNGRRGVIMRCDWKFVCGEMPVCFYSYKQACNGRLEFLSNVIIDEDRRTHLEVCCTFQLSPDNIATEQCQDVTVEARNNLGANASHTVRARTQRNAANIYKRDAAAAQDEVNQVKFRITAMKKNATTTTNELVKSVKLQPDGSMVIKLCNITCNPKDARNNPGAAVVVPVVPADSSQANAVVQPHPSGPQEEGPPPSEQEGGTSLGGSFPDINKLKCFSDDAVVHSPSGDKHLGDAKLGQTVLVVSDLQEHSNMFVYEPIELFMHNIRATKTQLLAIETENKRIITLSERHLIPIVPCSVDKDSNLFSLIDTHSMFAHHAKPGMCLIVSESAIRWNLDKIANVQLVVKTGLHAPITKSGTIVVNGIIASCFAEYEQQWFLRNVFRRYFLYRDAFYEIMGKLRIGHKHVGVDETETSLMTKTAYLICKWIF